jgi:aminoglycoside 3-N-acetyltransferase
MAVRGRLGDTRRVPDEAVLNKSFPLTRGELERGIRELGVRDGAAVIVHASLSRLGWVVGGSETVVRALLAAVGPSGTICAQTSWEDSPLGLDGWPSHWRRAYESEAPPFDPDVSEAAHFEGRLAERIRTWPGACRSGNPDASVAAVGARARELTADHSCDDAFGPGTPYARLVALRGQVLLLGAPLHTISLLHHAEALAAVPAKRRVAYRVPLRVNGGVRWRRCHDIDVRDGPFPYARHVPAGQEPLEEIARAALAAGLGDRLPIGRAACHRFEADDLTDFARAWIEDRFA